MLSNMSAARLLKDSDQAHDDRDDPRGDLAHHLQTQLQLKQRQAVLKLAPFPVELIQAAKNLIAPVEQLALPLAH